MRLFKKSFRQITIDSESFMKHHFYQPNKNGHYRKDDVKEMLEEFGSMQRSIFPRINRQIGTLILGTTLEAIMVITVLKLLNYLP